VQPHPDPHRHSARPLTGGEPTLRRDGRAHRIARAREHDEERVALRTKLIAAVRGDRTAHDPVVLRKYFGLALAEMLKQPRRALDIAKQRGDSAGR
jgi:hypothetical protein